MWVSDGDDDPGRGTDIYILAVRCFIIAHVRVHDETVEPDGAFLVEGLPGVGLVRKIATDHLVEQFSMRHYADVVCEGLPRIGVYGADSHAVSMPVRLYADPDRNVLALRSDVPVSPAAATEFAGCLTGWIADNDVMPVYLSGFPTEDRTTPPSSFGVATGDGDGLLDDAGIDTPRETGAISGPTGALVNEAAVSDVTTVTLVVESDPQFPDPEAAQVALEDGIEPLTDVEVDPTDLVEGAEEIRRQKKQFARRMQDAEEEASKAQPPRMYQ